MELNPQVLIYLNRLSDLLFILARLANAGRDEPLWKPGALNSRRLVRGRLCGSMLGLVLTPACPHRRLATRSPLRTLRDLSRAAASGAVSHARRPGRLARCRVDSAAVGRRRGRGALVADDVSENVLYAAIAAVLVWSGVDLALRPVRPLTRERLRLWPAVAGGVGIGALGGAVGVILGTLRMPTLVRLVGMDVKRAAGTNLVVGFLLGVAGFAAHAGSLGVDWAVLAAGLAGAIPGGWLGARATGRIDENVLRLALGAIPCSSAPSLRRRRSSGTRSRRSPWQADATSCAQSADGTGAQRADAVCRLRCDGDHGSKEDRAQVADEADSVLVHVDDDDLDVA
jgi:hypothetical protein